MIRKAILSDAHRVCRIYNHYVENSSVTFETEAVSDEYMKDRIEKVSANYPWLVFEEDEEILGFSYATRWKERQAYSFTAECAVYVDKNNQAKGIGSKLYSELIRECRNVGLHLLIAGIALPNEASIFMHEKLGFSYVGKFTEVGNKFGRWIDVGYWTLKLV
jgi:L-amino acid N-acyltransferase YncA